MKRTVALLLLIIIFTTWCAPYIFARESKNMDQAMVNTELDALSEYTCIYNRETKKIVLGGTVKHDVLISHKSYFLEVYRILPGDSYENIIWSPNVKPLASADIAVRFEFSLDVSNSLERFSHYAVVLRSPEGEKFLAARPHYAGIEAGYEHGDDNRSFFKGLQSSETVLAGELNAGTSVIPVYLDQLLNETSRGYIYTVGEDLFYFDKTYIDGLDCEIRSASLAGGRVYLQFLLPANGSSFAVANGKYMGASYDMPNVFSEEVLSRICAGSEFLADRYRTHQSGQISGIILGESIDDPIMNYFGSLSLDRYAKLYGFYLTVVAYSVRIHQPSADMIVPFSAENLFTTARSTSDTGKASELLDMILQIQEDSFSFPFRFGTMVNFDSDGIENIEKTADLMSDYSKYIESLKETYRSTPNHSMVRWSVPFEMEVTPLCANYAYLYYTLINEPLISSFVLSFAECETNGLERLIDLKPIFREIDTNQSMTATSSLPSYFGEDTWDDLIPNVSDRSYSVRNDFFVTSDSFVNQNWKGSFSYFDFSRGNIDDWFSGSGCSSIKTDYGSAGKRALRGTFEMIDGQAGGELFCLYEYPEFVSHTPMLSFRMAVAEELGDADGFYRVTVTLGNDQNRVVTQALLNGGELQNIAIDMRNIPIDQAIKYIKIGVSQIDGEVGSFSVRLYDVIGYSDTLSNAELQETIQAKRSAVRNLTEEDIQEDRGIIGWILGFLLLLIAIVVGILICFRHEDDSMEENDKNMKKE